MISITGAISAPEKILDFTRLTGAMPEDISQIAVCCDFRSMSIILMPGEFREAADRYIVIGKFKTFPIYAWGSTIGATITKLYAEWQAK